MPVMKSQLCRTMKERLNAALLICAQLVPNTCRKRPFATHPDLTQTKSRIICATSTCAVFDGEAISYADTTQRIPASPPCSTWNRYALRIHNEFVAVTVRPLLRRQVVTGSVLSSKSTSFDSQPKFDMYPKSPARCYLD
jgi:hypothetical protein